MEKFRPFRRKKTAPKDAPKDPIAATERVVDALNAHPSFDVDTYKHGRAVIEDLKATAEEDLQLNRQDVIAAKQTFIAGLKASGKPVEGDPVVAFMDKQLEFTDRQVGALERITKEVDRVRGQESMGVIAEFLADCEDALEKAEQYKDESGVTEVVETLRERYKQGVTDTQYRNESDGRISEKVRVNGGVIRINVDSEGTVSVHGRSLYDSSDIGKEEWRENPEVIGQGVIKALKNPDSDWV